MYYTYYNFIKKGTYYKTVRSIPLGLHRDGFGAVWGPDCKTGREKGRGAAWLAIAGMGQVIK